MAEFDDFLKDSIDPVLYKINNHKIETWKKIGCIAKKNILLFYSDSSEEILQVSKTKNESWDGIFFDRDSAARYLLKDYIYNYLDASIPEQHKLLCLLNENIQHFNMFICPECHNEHSYQPHLCGYQKDVNNVDIMTQCCEECEMRNCDDI